MIVPASDAKMNAAGPAGSPVPISNPDVGLNTVPVGAPPGMETCSGATVGMVPRTPPEYSVDRSAAVVGDPQR